MKKLAMAATLAAGLAVTASLPAQAYDYLGPPLVDGLMAGAIVGGADPYGYFGPVYGTSGRHGRVFHGPFYDHTVVNVPRRIRPGAERRSHQVNYYYPAPAYYGRPWSAGWGW